MTSIDPTDTNGSQGGIGSAAGNGGGAGGTFGVAGSNGYDGDTTLYGTGGGGGGAGAAGGRGGNIAGNGTGDGGAGGTAGTSGNRAAPATNIGGTAPAASGSDSAGGGGGGGNGILDASSNASFIIGSATGGRGGAGGSGTGGAGTVGGGGGSGGYGFAETGGNDGVTSTGTLTGGRGGNGGTSSVNQGNSNGGDGGGGAYLSGAGSTLTIDSVGIVRGGVGGTGGTGGSNAFGLPQYGGIGGKGGNGVVMIAGGTINNSGTIQGGAGGAAGDGAAGAGGAGVFGQNLTIVGTGTISGGMSGASAPVQADAVTFAGGAQNSLTLGGTLNGGLGLSGTLTLVATANATLSNVVHDASYGAGALVYNSASTLTLAGVNTYTGATTVQAGTLLVDGSIATSATFVASGATLGGTGTAGAVTVQSGGFVSPGHSPGILHTGNLTLAAGAHFVEQIGGTTPGTGYDQTIVVGTVTLNGATLDLARFGTPLFVSSPGQSFTIIDNDGTDAVSGTFAGLAEGATVSFAGETLRITYVGGTGNDVVLADVSPPAETVTGLVVAGDQVINAAEAAGATVQVTGTLSAALAAGDSVVVTIGGQSYTATASGTTFSVAVATPTAAGTATAHVLNTFGANADATQAYSLDAQAPSVTIATIAGDDVLNGAEAQGALTVTGTAPGAEDGQVVTVAIKNAAGTMTFASTTATVANGTWSLSFPAGTGTQLPDRTYLVTADVSDRAGNAAPEAQRTLLVDKFADQPPAATLTVDGTADGVVNAAEARAVSFAVAGLDGDATATARFTDGTHTASAAVAADGTFAIDLSGFSGSVTSSLAIIDVHANPASVAGNTVAFDTTAPAIPAAPLLANDTGSPGDRITRDATIGYPRPASGDTLLYSLDGTTFTTTAPTFAQDGTYTVRVAERDAAGNTSGTSSLTFTLDRNADLAPAATLAVSGTADGVVNAAEARGVSYTVAGLDADATGTVAFTDGTRTASASVAGNGTFVIDLSGFSGPVTSSLAIVDAAANTASVAGNTVPFDTIAPATPASPTLVADTGASAADRVTNDPRIGYPTPAAGDTLLYSLDGAMFGATAPTFATNGTADGQHTVAISERDAAGNVSGASSLTFMLDTVAPGAPTVALVRDTGLSATDRLTSDARFAVSTAEAGGSVVYTVDGAAVAAYDPLQLGQGAHTVTLVQSDTAGNVSSAATIAFTLDSVAPVLAVTGVSGATTIVEHAVSGTIDAADAGGLVTIRDGASLLGTVASDAQGHWTLPFAYQGPGNHAYHLTASETDAAGNTGLSTHFDFALDFTPNQGLFGTLVHDASGLGGQIFELYEGLLGRAPDPLGFENAVDAVGHGQSLASLTQGFLASPEYTAAHGPISAETDAGFVSELYQGVLGRAGDAAGTTFWTNALAQGTSRADAALSFALSSENLGQDAPVLGAGVFVPDPIASNVARLYYGVLDRAPDTSGIQFWSNAIKGGLGETAVAQSFLSSGEYAAGHGAAPSAEAFITGLYDGALGRTPEAGAVAYWQNALDRGLTRAQVAFDIAESPEARAHHVGDIEQGWHLA